MIENKSKIYNFRPIVGVCLFLIIGIFLSVTAIFNVRFYAVALIVTLCVFSAFLIRYILVKNKRHFIIALIFLVSTFIGAFLSYIPINDNFKSNLSGNFLVEGEIISVENIEYLENSVESKVLVKVKSGELKGQNVLLYLTSSKELFCGYKISCNAKIEKHSILENGKFNANFIRRGINYQSYSCKNVVIDENIDNPLFKIKRCLFTTLKNSPAINYGFIFALLTGDTNYINFNTLTNFRNTGVAHIFAVSGLHIGFLFVFISFIFKPFNQRSFVVYLIKMLLLFLYVLFCGATPSCLRAFVIISVASLTRLIGFKNDRLTTVFLSAIIILLLNPYDLFGVGFWLSFTASLSLIFLTPKFEVLFNKIFPNKVSKFVAPFVSAFLGTLPIVNDAFNNSTMFSMVFNAVIVPFMNILFILCFVSCVISLIFSSLSFILVVADFFVSCIKLFVEKFSFITTLSLDFIFGVSAIFYYVNLVIASGIFNLKTKTVKTILVINNVIFILAFIIVNFLNITYIP